MSTPLPDLAWVVARRVRHRDHAALLAVGRRHRRYRRHLTRLRFLLVIALDIAASSAVGWFSGFSALVLIAALDAAAAPFANAVAALIASSVAFGLTVGLSHQGVELASTDRSRARVRRHRVCRRRIRTDRSSALGAPDPRDQPRVGSRFGSRHQARACQKFWRSSSTCSSSSKNRCRGRTSSSTSRHSIPKAKKTSCEPRRWPGRMPIFTAGRSCASARASSAILRWNSARCSWSTCRKNRARLRCRSRRPRTAAWSSPS